MYAFENIMFYHNLSVTIIFYTSACDLKCSFDIEAVIKLSNR